MIIHGNWMENEIPDKSINLIIADPPYFEVKGDFDFIWPDFKTYLQQVEVWAAEMKRVLSDKGCLLYWGHAKKIAYSQVILDKYFNLGNSLVWEKTECQTRQQDFEQSRHFAPVTERCLFYTNEIEQTGREFVEKEFIAPRNPFAAEIRRARAASGLSVNEVAERGNFYGNVNHGGAVTNWEKGYNIPSMEQWRTLCHIIPLKIGYEDGRTDYDGLWSQYDALRVKFESERRPFNNIYKLTDVLKASQESNISSQYDHETIKPLTLTKKLIRIVSRPGDTILIPFGGSGTDVEAAIDTGRKYICFDIEKKNCETMQQREKVAKIQINLF